MICKILSNEKIANDVFRLEIEGKFNALPGQFVEIKLDNFFLRRPISICEIKENSIVLIYKIFGEGTKNLAFCHENLDVIGPFGNGFDIFHDKTDILLIGGGVGTPPLYELAKQLKNKPKIILGFNDKKDVFYHQEFEKLGCECFVATMNGTYGTKGTIIDVVKEQNLGKYFVYSCGPLPMLKAVQNEFSEGFLSLEARMACGIGVCMGCVVKTKNGESKRVCADGPVFKIGECEL